MNKFQKIILASKWQWNRKLKSTFKQSNWRLSFNFIWQAIPQNCTSIAKTLLWSISLKSLDKNVVWAASQVIWMNLRGGFKQRFQACRKQIIYSVVNANRQLFSEFCIKSFPTKVFQHVRRSMFITWISNYSTCPVLQFLESVRYAFSQTSPLYTTMIQIR